MPKLEHDGYRENITYGSVEAGKWGRVETYGPKLVENITQAVARDCLRDAMLEVAKTYPGIVMHIHDEMVVEVPKEQADTALKDILAIMARGVDWAPGLLLKGAGYITEFYMKD
jgi:DNA polymerase